MNNREHNTTSNCGCQEAGAKPVDLAAVVESCACGSKFTDANSNQMGSQTAVADGGVASQNAGAVEGCCGNTSKVAGGQIVADATSCCVATDSAHSSATVCGCNPNTNSTTGMGQVKAEASADVLNLVPADRDGAQRVHNPHPFVAQLKLRSNPAQPASDGCCGGNAKVKTNAASLIEVDGLNAEQRNKNQDECCVNESGLGSKNFDISHESIIAGELALSIEERK